MSRADWALCFFSSLTRVSISSAQTHCYTKKLAKVAASILFCLLKKT
jgi:hypothetical protein